MEKQTDLVLKWMKKGHTVTPMDALRKFGIFRLASVIHDLRHAGNAILMELESDGEKRWGRYTLVKAAK